MTRFVTFAVDVVVMGDGVPVACLVGVPGREGEVWLYRGDQGWRPLWPTRGLPALLPARPGAGQVDLVAILAEACPELCEV